MGEVEAGIVAQRESIYPLTLYWKRVPEPIRKALALSVGLALPATGMLLIVPPGPFTILLVITGLAVTATEFTWAAVMTEKTRHHGEQLWGLVRGHASHPRRQGSQGLPHLTAGEGAVRRQVRRRPG
jgi:hypothetical protein